VIQGGTGGAGPTVYGLGHGDRSSEDLLECLRSFDILVVADVRSYPSSRRHPRFDRDEMERAISAAGLVYRWLGRELGGYRPEGYEAYMRTAPFRDGIERLSALARRDPTVFLCAERDPAGCHRRFIALELVARGFAVEHIVEPGRALLPGERPEDQGTLF
jgi:uncharacterized protein (DUF488 family)